MKAFALAVAFAIAACSPAAAHQYKAGELSVGHPWSRPAAVGMTGAGYLTVTNSGDEGDVLLRVETPAAARVEIHESSTDGGVMRMKKLRNLPIPPNGRVVLGPGGNHLMMLKLKRPLGIGDKVPATLVFKRAGRVEVKFLVQAGPRKNKHGH
jgi:copper(I)-binding protein